MKVIFITSFPFPNGNATANRVRVFAEQLLRISNINMVEILCCSDEPTSTSVFSENIQVSNFQTKPVNKNRLFFRAINELNLAIKLWRQVKAKDEDIIFVTIPSVLLLIPIAFSKRKNLIALDVRDAVWTYFDEGVSSRIISFVIKKIFFLAARKTEIISVTNSQEAKHVELIIGKLPLVVANGISKGKLDEMKRLKIKSLRDNIKLAYIGNVGIAQEIDRLLDFVKDAPNLEATIVGNGAKLEELRTKCAIEQINNVFFTGLVPPNEISKHIITADILFAQIGKNFCSAVPTKIFEYIASGRRILLGLPEGPARAIFSKFHGVEIFNVGDNEEFKASYKRLIEKEFNEKMRRRNLQILEERYLRENSAKKLTQSIQKTANINCNKL